MHGSYFTRVSMGLLYLGLILHRSHHSSNYPLFEKFQGCTFGFSSPSLSGPYGWSVQNGRFLITCVFFIFEHIFSLIQFNVFDRFMQMFAAVCLFGIKSIDYRSVLPITNIKHRLVWWAPCIGCSFCSHLFWLFKNVLNKVTTKKWFRQFVMVN